MRGHLSNRRRFWGARTLVALAAISVIGALPFGAQVLQAAGQIVAQQQLSSTSDQSEAPQVAVNSAGNVAAVWGERFGRSLGYSGGNVGGALSGGNYLNTGSNFQYQWADVAVDKNGVAHVAYAVGDVIFYRSRPAGGGWSSAVRVAGTSFPNPVRIAVAPNGVIWVVWRDADGSGVFFRFSDNNGAGWSGGNAGGVVQRDDGNMSSPDVAVGTDNIPHVVWYTRSSGSDKGEVEYADWNGSAFVSGRITNDGSVRYDADPAITVDGNNVQHVVYRKQAGDDWVITYARREAGKAWADFTPLHETDGDAKYPPAIGSDTLGSVYITFSDPQGSSARRIGLLARPAGQAWQPLQAISTGRWDTRTGVAGSTASGIEALVTYQHEQGADDGEIIYKRLLYGPSVTLPEAVPQIAGGAQFTKASTVNVTFSGVKGDPKEIRWKWGSAPTDASNDSGGWKTFANPISIALPANLGGNCAGLTLYTQTRNGGNVETTAKSAAITFDAAVQAQVNAVNPHRAGLPSTALQTQDTLVQGASDGATNYTRDARVFLGINNTADCSGLNTFQVGTANAVLISGDKFEGFVDVPGISSIGEKNVVVTVTDKATNSATFTQTFVYDPLDDPTVQGANDGAPIVSGGTVSDTSVTTNTVLRTLSFADVAVQDNQYGQREGLGARSQFWGVWVAVSRTDVNPNDVAAGLQWFPARISNPGPAFSLQWSLFSGLSADQRTAGQYFIYVKFLDGAGNASLQTISTTTTLAPGFSLPSSALPLIVK